MPFDLEPAMAAWRNALKHRRAFLDGDLEELERHLRDHINTLVAAGYSEENAFHTAQSSLGDFAFLETSYRAVYWRKYKHQHTLLFILLTQGAMVKNYLRVALRAMVKHKSFSLINISGLAVGLACSFFILLWMQHELSIDQFHTHGDRLYAVHIESHTATASTLWANVPYPLAEALEETYAAVEHAIPLLPIQATLQSESGDAATRELGYFAHPGFFDAFTFPLLAGDPTTALHSPAEVFISEALAQKHFGLIEQGYADLLGQTITLNGWQSNGGVLGQAVRVDDARPFTIAGIFTSPTALSSLQFDVVLPATVVVQRFPHVTEWGPRWFELVLLLEDEVDPASFRSSVSSFLNAHLEAAAQETLTLQPFRDGYLNSAFLNGAPVTPRIRHVYVMGFIGLVLLSIACINFSNLVTAQSQQRAQEIGVRKVLGATPRALIQQFLGESMLMAVCAAAFAVGLITLATPLFASLTGLPLSLSAISWPQWALFFGIALGAGLVAGMYPAFYLASLHALAVFRQRVTHRSTGRRALHRGLVVLQFAMSAFLLFGTWVMYQQLHYLQHKELGLTHNDVLLIPVEGRSAGSFDVVRQALKDTPSIVSITRSSEHPLGVATKNAHVLWQGKGLHDELLFTTLRTDDAFAQTMGVELVAGRFFDADRDTGMLRYVINASAAQAMGLANPIGHPFAMGYDAEEGQLGEIIGVVKDFHTASLAHETIGPVVFEALLADDAYTYPFLLIRTAPRQHAEALSQLETLHARLNPGTVFEYAFLDEAYQAYYAEEQLLSRLTRVFALVALFIATLGLFGLSAFSVHQRLKEICLRRVLGATKSQIFYLLSVEYLRLVFYALLLALPLGYWASVQWLNGFAYRMTPNLADLGSVAGLLFVITLLTISYHTVQADQAQPANILRAT
ncbi:MAG: ABC transporter permease [Rhodothermales bacterium]